VRQGALVLFGLPVQLIWAYGFELVKLGNQDTEVKVMA
jgi:hypothetical protein